MTTYAAHGFYIHDLRGFHECFSGITVESAEECLRCSPYTRHCPGEELLSNKGFTLVLVDCGLAYFIYNSDGRYSFWVASEEDALDALRLPSLDALRPGQPTSKGPFRL